MTKNKDLHPVCHWSLLENPSHPVSEGAPWAELHHTSQYSQVHFSQVWTGAAHCMECDSVFSCCWRITTF